MRITRIRSKNIKGFEEFDQLCGDVNIFSGRNGGGKTSSLSLLTGAFGKASTRMLRHGAESGEIAIDIVDEEETFELVRRFTQDKVATAVVKSSRTGKLGAPVDWLKGILDLVSMDPLRRAMDADEEQQAKVLLETMPLELERGAIGGAIGDKLGVPEKLLNEAGRKPALDAIKLVEDYIYDARTKVNGEAKSKRATADELRQASTAGSDDRDWQAEVTRLNAVIEALLVQERDDTATAVSNAAILARKITEEETAAKLQIDSDIDERIAVLEAERKRRHEAENERYKELRNGAKASYEADVRAIGNKVGQQRSALDAERGAAQQQLRQQTEAARDRANAEKYDKEAAALEEQSKAMTTALDNLTKLREKLLEKLPIPGFKVENNVPYLDGLPLSEVNTQKQIAFWVRVAVMKGKEFGIIVLDNMERLDDNHFEKFIAVCLKASRTYGCQWFLGRVTTEDFNIRTINIDVLDAESIAQ